MIDTLIPKHHDLIDIMRPRISFATPVSAEERYCVILSVIPAGAVIPVHSHADRETLYVIDGRLEGLLGSTWQTFGPHSVSHLPHPVHCSATPADFQFWRESRGLWRRSNGPPRCGR